MEGETIYRPRRGGVGGALLSLGMLYRAIRPYYPRLLMAVRWAVVALPWLGGLWRRGGGYVVRRAAAGAAGVGGVDTDAGGWGRGGYGSGPTAGDGWAMTAMVGKNGGCDRLIGCGI